jgi:hypothetical protein
MPESISLESFVARLNAQAFWREFTFARNTFSPRPGQELELADNFVWLGEFAFALQLKQREGVSSSPERERKWFKSKVLTNGTRQIRDTLDFLKAHDRIQITNERGRCFDVRSGALTDITKIVVYFGSKSLPEECWQTRHYVSSTAGFIHVVAAHDYLGILETLRVPKDIRDYFSYRQEVVSQLEDTSVDEPDIMGGFITSEKQPTPISRNHLHRFVQDAQAFDLSFLIGRLHDHIQNGDGSQDYYQIMLEFARVPRSVWREVRTRFDLCFKAAKNWEFTAPFRLAFPGSGCTFMIAALDPKLPSTGAEGERIRINALKMLTYGAMYDMCMERSVGILISRDGELYQIDWCRVDMPQARDPEIEALLAKHNPFRPAREKTINSFVFKIDQS